MIRIVAITLLSLSMSFSTHAENDARQFVKMPEMMQQHMMANMRQHLESINEILFLMSNKKLDQAADVAEKKLGMTSLQSHNASHMAKFMPKGMRQAGTSMHKSASRFALKAQEGDQEGAYKILNDVTSACVTCHAGYRIR